MAGVRDLFIPSLLQPAQQPQRPSSPWLAMRSNPYQGEPLTDADMKGIMDEVAQKQTQRNMHGLPNADQNPLPANQIPYASGFVPPEGTPSASGSAYGPVGGQQQGFAPKAFTPNTPKTKEDLLQKLFDRDMQAAGALRSNMSPFLAQFDAFRGAEQGVDLTPLAALVDQWSGSNFAKTYKAPESLYDRGREVMGQADKYRFAADDREVGALKDLVQGRRAESKDQEDSAYKKAMLKLEQDKLAQAKGADPFKLFDVKNKIAGTDDAKQVGGIISFNNALNRYLEKVDAYGVQMTGEKANELDSAYSELKTSYKEAKKLGALAGPDLEILVEAMTPAAGLKAGITNWMPGTDVVGGIRGQAQIIRANSDQEMTRLLGNLNNVTSDIAPVARPVLGGYENAYLQARGARKEDPAAGNTGSGGTITPAMREAARQERLRRQQGGR